MPTAGSRPTLRPVPLFTGVAVVAVAVLFLFDPNHFAFYPGCMFYRVTGLLCPGCGCLRALHQLLHGHPFAAFHCNPLLLVTLAMMAGFGLADWVRKRNDPQARSSWQWLLANPVWLWAYFGVVLLFWVLRNLPGPVCALLRP